MPSLPKIDALVQQSLDKSNQTAAIGKEQLALGESGMFPVFDYLKKAAGGDKATLAQAAQPETARITTQYDTARRAISNFAPKGGGAVSATAESFAKEGSDIASATAKVRTDAVSELGTLSAQISQLGVNASTASADELSQALQALIGRDAASKSMWGQIAGGAGQAAGSIIAAAMLL